MSRMHYCMSETAHQWDCRHLGTSPSADTMLTIKFKFSTIISQSLSIWRMKYIHVYTYIHIHISPTRSTEISRHLKGWHINIFVEDEYSLFLCALTVFIFLQYLMIFCAEYVPSFSYCIYHAFFCVFSFPRGKQREKKIFFYFSSHWYLRIHKMLLKYVPIQL